MTENAARPFRVLKTTYTEAEITENQLFPVVGEEGMAPEFPEIQVVGARGVTWLHVGGPHRPEMLAALGRRYDIHPLVLEDILNTDHRPKAEDYDNCLFIVLKRLDCPAAFAPLREEQVCVLLTGDTVLSFQETDRPLFEDVQRRLKNRMGRIRRSGADFLAYTLVDALVDGYFEIIASLEAEIEEVEEALLRGASSEHLEAIQRLKRKILSAWKHIAPLREAILRLRQPESTLIADDTRLYLRDLLDHVSTVSETVETLREMVDGLMMLYHTSVSGHLNEVLKMLTIISTIFIPLNFIAAIYGMNFKNMPELDMPYGYAGVWMVIGGIALGMLAFFRGKSGCDGHGRQCEIHECSPRRHSDHRHG